MESKHSQMWRKSAAAESEAGTEPGIRRTRIQHGCEISARMPAPPQPPVNQTNIFITVTTYNQKHLSLQKTHHLFHNRVRFGHSKSSKVDNFRTNWKHVCDFLLVCHCNYAPILHCFWDMATYWLKIQIFAFFLNSVAKIRIKFELCICTRPKVACLVDHPSCVTGPASQRLWPCVPVAALRSCYWCAWCWRDRHPQARVLSEFEFEIVIWSSKIRTSFDIPNCNSTEMCLWLKMYTRKRIWMNTSMKKTATAIPIRIATLSVRNDSRLASQPYTDISHYI